MVVTAASALAMGTSSSSNQHSETSKSALTAITTGRTPAGTNATGSPTATTPAEPRAANPSVTVTVSPKRAAVTVTTQTQQFTSSVTGATWGVDGIAGGNGTVGTISPSGLYTPPATAGIHSITATSGASSGSATIAVTDLSAADFDNGIGTVHVEGNLTLNGDPVRCIAIIDLVTLRGTGRLVLEEKAEASALQPL